MNPRFYIKRRCEYRGKQGSYLCYAYHLRLLCLWTMSMAIHFMVTYYKSLATMCMKEFENLILNCFFKVEYSLKNKMAETLLAYRIV